MSKSVVGVRNLTILGEFKPFGLLAETLDATTTTTTATTTDNAADKYDYFLFDPQLTQLNGEVDFSDASPSSFFSDAADHEIFIRGNRVMWIAGSRVYKRFTLSSTVIMACWCHMAHLAEAVLCVLQVDALTIFDTSGELRSIPLPGIITSIWPLPFGLLLQQAAEGNPPSSSSSFLSARDISLSRREIHHSPQQGLGFPSMNYIGKGTISSVSSHLILNEPLEEPQPTFIDERGEVMMKDFDERTIWSSDRVPLIATYNRDKMQHSLWLVECVNSFSGQEAYSSSHFYGTEVSPKQFSFQRIWQAKGSQTAATKVFLATDENATPIICLLFQEQKSLLCMGLKVEKK